MNGVDWLGTGSTVVERLGVLTDLVFDLMFLQFYHCGFKAIQTRFQLSVPLNQIVQYGVHICWRITIHIWIDA